MQGSITHNAQTALLGLIFLRSQTVHQAIRASFLCATKQSFIHSFFTHEYVPSFFLGRPGIFFSFSMLLSLEACHSSNPLFISVYLNFFLSDYLFVCLFSCGNVRVCVIMCVCVFLCLCMIMCMCVSLHGCRGRDAPLCWTYTRVGLNPL